MTHVEPGGRGFCFRISPPKFPLCTTNIPLSYSRAQFYKVSLSTKFIAFVVTKCESQRCRFIPAAAWPWQKQCERAADVSEQDTSEVGGSSCSRIEEEELRKSVEGDSNLSPQGCNFGNVYTIGKQGHDEQTTLQRVHKQKRRQAHSDVSSLLQRLSVESEEDEDDKGPESTWLPEAPSVGRPRAVYSPAALAYLGDGVYELYARRHFLMPPQSVDKYSKRVMSVVCCEAQDALLQRLLASTFLSPVERDVVRWGKNASSGSRRAKGRAGGAVYSSATGLETLVGYLYLTNGRRLNAVMTQLGFSCNGNEVESDTSPGSINQTIANRSYDSLPGLASEANSTLGEDALPIIEFPPSIAEVAEPQMSAKNRLQREGNSGVRMEFVRSWLLAWVQPSEGGSSVQMQPLYNKYVESFRVEGDDEKEAMTLMPVSRQVFYLVARELATSHWKTVEWVGRTGKGAILKGARLQEELTD